MGRRIFLLLALFLCLTCVALISAQDDVEEKKTEDAPVEEEELVMDEGEGAGDEEDEPVPEERDVLVLNNKNFRKVAFKEGSVVLVEFYAPWCGHCKALTPEFEQAAAELKKNDPPVVLAKVDATVEKELGSHYEVQGYPTLKFFRDGNMYDYEGPRKADGIVTYMKERADPNWKPPPSAVVDLTKETFDEFVDQHDLSLVEFYTPWCGHCKKFAPEYEKAAQDLIKNDPPIPLAKVDCSKEVDLATRFGVKGYPTLKVYRKGKPYEYKGERDNYGVQDFMRKQIGDGSKVMQTADEKKKVQPEDDVLIIGYFTGEDDKLFEPYTAVANELREEYKFYHTFDKDIAKKHKAKQSTVVLYHPERFHTKHEEKLYTFDKSDATDEDLKTYLETHHVPLVGHMTRHNEKLRYTARPLCILFYTVDFSFQHRDATQLWRKKFATIARDFKDITFAIADEDDMNVLFKEFGLDDSGEELNVGCFDKDGMRYPMEAMEEYDSDHIRSYLKDFQKGKAKPKLKSQPVPKKQGPVITVVGNSFNEIVENNDKDVLIEFYAPWCGHCKKLAPIYTQLAKKLKDEKNLVIAKIDSTANDHPKKYEISGFPTIYLARAGKKDSPLAFEGARTVDGIMEFLKANSQVAFKSTTKDEL